MRHALLPQNYNCGAPLDDWPLGQRNHHPSA